MSGSEDDIIISEEEFEQASQQSGASQDIGDTDRQAEGNSQPDTSGDSTPSGDSGGGSSAPETDGPDVGAGDPTLRGPGGERASSPGETTPAPETEAAPGEPGLRSGDGERVSAPEDDSQPPSTPPEPTESGTSGSGESDGGSSETQPDPTADPDGNGLSRAEEQDANAALEEDVASINEERQGVETGTGRVGQQASRLEQDFLDANPGLDPDDVRIVRDGDTIRPAVTAEGREDLGLNPSNRDLRQEVAAATDGVAPDDVTVERTGSDIDASLTEEARRERLRERAAAEFGVSGSAVDLDRQDGELVARVDQQFVNGRGEVGPIRRAPEGPARDGTSGPGESVITSVREQVLDRPDSPRQRRQTDIEDATRGETASDPTGVEQARQQAERALEEQLGVDLTDSDIDFALRRGRVQARLSDEGERTVARERAPGQGTPVEGLFEAGAETRVAIDQATDPVANRFDEVTPDEDAVTRRIPDGSDIVSGTGLAAAATAGVVAPEPVSTGTGALVLGGLAAGGVAAEVARRSGAFEGDGVPDETVEQSEIPVPADGEPVRDSELGVPEQGEPVAQNELSVPEDRRTVAPEEIGVPREAIRDGRAEINGPDGVDITDDGEIVIPRETTVVARRTRGEDEEDEDEEGEESSEESDEDNVIVEVPEEMLPDEEVTIGEEPVNESSEESVDDEDSGETEEEEIVRRDEQVAPTQPAQERGGVAGGQQDRDITQDQVQEPAVEPAEPIEDVIEDTRAATPDPRPAAPAALIREAQAQEVGAQADAVLDGVLEQDGQLVGDQTFTTPAERLATQQAQAPAFQQQQLALQQPVVPGAVFAEPVETIADETAINEPVGIITDTPRPPRSRRTRPRDDPDLGREFVETEPRGAPRGADRTPTFGFFAETAQGFLTPGIGDPEAPSQEQLEALQTPAGGDLPTRAILEGEVDIDRARDFFRAGEVRF